MNKKGSTVFFLLMLGIIFFLLALALAPSLVQTSNEARTQLDCTNVSISNQDKANCYQIDSIPPMYVGLIFGLGGLILARLLG